MVRIFCACRGEETSCLDSHDMVTRNYGIVELVSGTVQSMAVQRAVRAWKKLGELEIFEGGSSCI